MKFPNITNSEVAEIIKLKNAGKSFEKLNELALKLGPNDLSKIIENTDNLILGSLKGDPTNFVQKVNVMNVTSKLELVGQAFDFLDLAYALKEMAGHSGDLSSTFNTMISLLPISGAGLYALVFQQISNDMEEDFNKAVWQSGGWDMVRDCNENWKGERGDFVYMYYTDEPERVNPTLLPTSFIIIDERLASEIFGFRPIYANCYFKNQIKFDGSRVYFMPDIQVIYKK